MLSRTFRTIGQLHGSVAVKVDRGGVTKAAQSRTDVGDIKTVSDAISSILEVFDVRSIIINRASPLISGQFETGLAVERQVGKIAQDVKDQREERLAEKAEHQKKEDRDEAERREKECKETIAAGSSPVHLVISIS